MEHRNERMEREQRHFKKKMKRLSAHKRNRVRREVKEAEERDWKRRDWKRIITEELNSL